MTLNQAFYRTLKKCNFDEKYESVNRHKITPHVLRAYFFTNADVFMMKTMPTNLWA